MKPQFSVDGSHSHQMYVWHPHM